MKGALQALDSVVSWLAGVPGRKAILYVSDGLPLTPGQDLFSQFAKGNTAPSHTVSGMTTKEFDLTRQFRAVTSHASRNRITFYPIEVFNTEIPARQRDPVRAGQRTPEWSALPGRGHGRPGPDQCGVPPDRPTARRAGPHLLLLSGLHAGPSGDEAEHKIEVKVKVRDAGALPPVVSRQAGGGIRGRADPGGDALRSGGQPPGRLAGDPAGEGAGRSDAASEGAGCEALPAAQG